MTRLFVEAQGQVDSEVVSIEEGTCLVLGRVPSGEELDAFTSVMPRLPVTARAVASPSVSANHMAIWTTGAELSVVDLDSRNGTWVRLPRATAVSFPASDELHVRLASAQWVAGGEQHPEPPRYQDAADFGAAVAEVVRLWLQRNDIPARTWAEPQASSASNSLTGVTPLRLANGEALHIQPERTVDGGFHERMLQISRFLNVQNALFTAEEDTRNNGMVLASPSIRMVHRRVVELGMQGIPSVILLGASGSGKERLAQSYHRALGRTGPLVALNCATLSRERVVADLFGAEAGAYTDAKRAMTGAVERADGGTLFLDELGELPLDVQPLLLRFLETGEYQRLGSAGRPRFADARVVAATNRDLRRMVREGLFREDLFFRLALEVVEVPPLQDRFPDVAAYLRTQLLGDVSVFDALLPDALELLRTYRWTGNFRELVNLVRRLPRPASRQSLDIAIIRRALEAGSLAGVSVAPPTRSATSAGPAAWLDWVRASADAYMASTAQDGPQTWGDMTAFVEHFLKPWALAHLGGAASEKELESISVGQIADIVRADRGTVTKQLRRYFEAQRDSGTSS